MAKKEDTDFMSIDELEKEMKKELKKMNKDLK